MTNEMIAFLNAATTAELLELNRLCRTLCSDRDVLRLSNM